MTTKPHYCDERCACPVHGTPLIYSPAAGDHACQDITCEYGHGGWPRSRDDWPWLILGEAFPAGPLFLDLTPEQRERQQRAYRSSGYLTRDMITRALDELWNPPRVLAPPGYLGARQPFGTVPMPQPREPEWTVRAGGWRLVIQDGAMTGIVREDTT